MKLINHTLLFLSAILLVTVSLWGVLFYFQLLNRVKTTLDKGLSDYKIVLIDKLKDDSLIVERSVFRESNYIIRKINEDFALQVRDSYKDTLIHSDLKDRNYQTRLLTTAFLATDSEYYEIKVISQELDRENFKKEIATSMLRLYLFLFISTIIVNNFVLKKTWKPFYNLLSFLDKFHLDKGTYYEPPETRIREFSLLNESVSNLVKTNIGVFNKQKQFIENASHELQTPLAIGINKLELLADEKDLSPVNVKRIGNIIEIFQRLSGLNKSLLLLSKIENRQFFSVEVLNFEDIINKIINDFSDYLEYRKITVKYYKEESWVVNMNRTLADIIVMNLLKNAIIHNRQGGEIIITLSSDYFSIENTGDEAPVPAERLFERFVRNPKNSSSTGLGLAISKAIAEVSDLSLTYSYNGMHLFRLSCSS